MPIPFALCFSLLGSAPQAEQDTSGTKDSDSTDLWLCPTIQTRALKVIQLVLGESCRYALAALWAAMLTCATASAQTPHVRLESGSAHGSKIEAIHDDKKIPLQFRSIVVQTDFPGEKSGECAVQMIYDPESKLFEWHSFQTYQGYDAEFLGHGNCSGRGMHVGRESTCGLRRNCISARSSFQCFVEGTSAVFLDN
jgi:hypothetical protein